MNAATALTIVLLALIGGMLAMRIATRRLHTLPHKAPAEPAHSPAENDLRRRLSALHERSDRRDAKVRGLRDQMQSLRTGRRG
jgi:uncharacterized coiled-coil DUF342 family protein